MQKVCVIGYGYIGSSIAYHLKQSYDVSVVSKTKGKLEFQDVNYCYAKYTQLDKEFYSQFDIVIFTAGKSGRSIESMNITDVVLSELLGVMYLLEIMSTSQQFIYMSSAAVYGNEQTERHQVNKEDDALISTSQSQYAMIKQWIDQLVITTMKQNPLKQIIGLRIGTVNGLINESCSEFLRTDLLINKMMYDAKESLVVEYSNPLINRSVVGMNDLVSLVEHIIKNGNITDSGVYNVSSFDASVWDVVQEVCSATQTKFQLIGNETKPYNFKLDTSKINNTFPEFSFKDNLHTIINSMQTVYKNDCSVLKSTEMKEFEMENKCRVCRQPTDELLNLGYQPLANNYHMPNEVLSNYQLNLHVCENCFHVQLNCTVNPEILFKNYLYVSGTSKTGREYFQSFAKQSLDNFKGDKKNTIRVLDIACNDGSQLDAFKEQSALLGFEVETYGVDPAENLYPVSSSKGHKVWVGFFNQDVINEIGDIRFDIIVAQNVFAHISYPKEFLGYCKQVLRDANSSSIYIQTSQANMILNNEFDTAYHEHLSFFNTNSMKLLCESNGLVLNNVTKVPIHGTSYLFQIQGTQSNESNTSAILYEEMIDGLYDRNTYDKYYYNCLKYKNEFSNMLLDHKLHGWKIIGVGSTAKSNTLLNFTSMDNAIFDYIIDENPLKQGLLTPGSNIPVVGFDILREFDLNAKYAFVVLAWNFFDEVYTKIDTNTKALGLLPENLTVININPLKTYDLLDLE